MVLTDAEKELQSKPAEVAWKDENGNIVKGKKIVDFLPGNRRQPGKEYEYEVVFRNEGRSPNGIYLDLKTLDKMGWGKACKAIDARIAQTAGLIPRPLTASTVEQHLKDVGLEAEFATHYRMKALSGGQKVKVVMAAALWNQPHILILDEPTNYLDREALGALAGAIEDYQGGVVIISHNNEFVSTLCKEEWVMESGHLTTKGESGWMDRQDDKMDDQAAITSITDAFGNAVAIQQVKKLSKKEEKLFVKKIKDKIKAGVELDEDESDYAIKNNIY